MTDFRSLMQLSATLTEQAQSAVKLALDERRRKEDLRRKQRDEQERKEQELARTMRLRHFEEQRRERERLQRLEQEQQAKAAALKRREEQMKNALIYGPKKAKSLPPGSGGASPKWPSSSSQDRVRAEVRKRRVPSEGGDGADDVDTSSFLTREEKRERKQQMEMKRSFHTKKRPSSTLGYSRTKKRLPGGAVDITTSEDIVGGDAAQFNNLSVKERLATMMPGLTKLNVVKRDIRTIDEIMTERAKARESKILDGDKAREFDDWFGSSKKKKEVPSPKRPSSQLPAFSAATSGANTPASQDSKPSTPTPASNAFKKAGSVPVKSTASLSRSRKSSANGSAKSLPSRFSDKHISGGSSRPLKPSTAPQTKKRPRSPSISDSPPPKRHIVEDDMNTNVRDEIWKLFRKDRNAYVSRDVFSDDEDMEADAFILEKEEKQSARIAKREDDIALAEERRREEDKRRRKMMRDRD